MAGTLIKHFKWIPFAIGVIAGLLTLFFVKPEKVVVTDYPHPDNIKSRVYRDKNGACYKYTSVKVDCDANEATLKPYPLQ